MVRGGRWTGPGHLAHGEGRQLRWPWHRHAKSSVRAADQRGSEPRLGLRITPEAPPEVRATLEHHVFGHVDEASDWLATFLAEHELDDLGTRHVAGDLTPAQEARVREIVASGRPRQGLFNLLMWPQLIPPDIRLDAVRGAVRQTHDPYLRIAAVVGLEGGAVEVSDSEWPSVRDELLTALGDPRAAIRNRVTVALSRRLRVSDGPAILRSVAEAGLGGTELENVLAALIRVGADDAAPDLLPRMLEQGVSRPEVRAWLESWQAAGSRAASPPPRWFGLPALAYIPNLDE